MSNAITGAQRDTLWRELGREPTAEELVIRYAPHRYASIASQVDLAMRLSDRGCTGDGCDLDDPCPRHARVGRVVDRYIRLKNRSVHR